MNYTNNYHLPQWDENDRILRSDFNQMCADIDSNIHAARTDAAQAKTEASTKPYQTGSYNGSGENSSQFISLGFRPSFVIVTGAKLCNGVGDGDPVLYMGISGGNATTNAISFSSNGFTVKKPSNGYPSLNASGRTYDYIAFK